MDVSHIVQELAESGVGVRLFSDAVVDSATFARDAHGRWALSSKSGIVQLNLFGDISVTIYRETSSLDEVVDVVANTIDAHERLTLMTRVEPIELRLERILREVLDVRGLDVCSADGQAADAAHMFLSGNNFMAFASVANNMASMDITYGTGASSSSDSWKVPCPGVATPRTYAAVVKALTASCATVPDVLVLDSSSDVESVNSSGDVESINSSGEAMSLETPYASPAAQAADAAAAKIETALDDAKAAYADWVHTHNVNAANAIAALARAATGDAYTRLYLDALPAVPPDDLPSTRRQYVLRTKAQLVYHMLAVVAAARPGWDPKTPVPPMSRMYPAVGAGAYVERTWLTRTPAADARPEALQSVLWAALMKLFGPATYRIRHSNDELAVTLNKFAPGALYVFDIPEKYDDNLAPRGLTKFDYVFLFMFLFRSTLLATHALLTDRADGYAATKNAVLSAVQQMLSPSDPRVTPEVRHLLFCAMIPELLRRRVSDAHGTGIHALLSGPVSPSPAQLLWALWNAAPELARVADWTADACPTYAQFSAAWAHGNTYVELFAGAADE